MRYIVEASDIKKFKFCPYCGSNLISVNDGDYNGQTECTKCEEELEFLILEEYRERYPARFETMIRR